MINKKASVFVTGHRGMVGSRLVEKMKKNGFNNLILAGSDQLDLRNQVEVNSFFIKYKPMYVIHLAAKVGGINANINYPATFMYDNLIMQANIIHASHINGVKKFLFLGSSCIYPKNCPQPMKEEYLMSGFLEPTNEGYAIGKIAGIKLLEFYKRQYGMNSISLIPSNLYGPNDNFDLETSHVLSALVKRFVDAKESEIPSVVLWGSGNARREFLHVDDLVDAVLFFFENYDDLDFINIGEGKDISINELAELISVKTKYAGNILWDSQRPDGMLKKCMDVSRMRQLGFFPKFQFDDGVEQVIQSYFNQKKNVS